MKKKRTIRRAFTKFKQHEQKNVIHVILYIALSFIMFGAMLSNVMPDKIDAKLYDIAEKDIYSPITIDDTEKTNEKKRAAAEAVSLKYKELPQKRQEQVAVVKNIFSAIANLTKPVDEKDNEAAELPLDDKIEQLKMSLPEDLQSVMSEQSLSVLLTSTSSQLELAEDVTVNAVNEIMQQHVTTENISEKQSRVEEFISNPELSVNLQSTILKLTQKLITPNYVYDAEATEAARKEAMEAVENVTIKENTLIVSQGEMIRPEIMEKLKLVGLLESNFNPYPYIGLSILVLLLAAVLIYFLRDIYSKRRNYNLDLLMYVAIFFLTLLFMKVTSLLTGSVSGIGYIVPVAVGVMMLKLLINEQIALVTSIIFAVTGSIIFNEATTSPFHFTFGIYILFSCLAGVIFLGKKSSKTNILRTGLWICLTNVLVVCLILALSNGQYNWIQIGSYTGFAFLSGFLAAVFTIGLIPYFEEVFGILSSLKLIELSNPNHPLLRKLLMEAPGTYHHSIVVANLSEAACEAVGVNGLLARVGAYYHDVGKTKRPHFFIENQMNIENPHDKIAPQLSKTIIIAHPYDGSEMLRKHNLPKEIIDIAEQHHGTTLLKYFYHKASQLTDKEVSEADFRYPGPKAQTKEAAIVGIADSVEAAVRSLAKPTPVKIESIVNKIIADRIEDGQLNECDLTFKELDTIAKAICETLQGMFHSRIEYPEEIKKKVSHG